MRVCVPVFFFPSVFVLLFFFVPGVNELEACIFFLFFFFLPPSPRIDWVAGLGLAS